MCTGWLRASTKPCELLREGIEMKLVIGLVVALASSSAALAQEAVGRVLFENVDVFDGMNEALIEDVNVLVEDNVISQITSADIESRGAVVIDGSDHTLMPGLTDAHYHVMTATLPASKIFGEHPGYMHTVAVLEAEALLMRGFTTVRDLGGPVFGLKSAIDDGVVPGPRIYPSGPLISQTSGHGDVRTRMQVPAEANRILEPLERTGLGIVADGRPAVLQRVREALMQGASQIKVMAGGGISSSNDPIDASQYTLDELKAAVEAAASWNTYVTVHAYTSDAVRLAVEAGVQCIDHGQLIDEETIKLLAEKGVWLSMQPFLDDEDAMFPAEGSPNLQRGKFLRVAEGTKRAYELARKHGVKVAFGTDIAYDPELAKRHGYQLAKLTQWYSPFEVLKMATHDNQQLFALSGPRNPYPGKNGVIEEGAYADILLVAGNPLTDISLIGNPEDNFTIIMKDGHIYKNILE